MASKLFPVLASIELRYPVASAWNMLVMITSSGSGSSPSSLNAFVSTCGILRLSASAFRRNCECRIFNVLNLEPGYEYAVPNRIVKEMRWRPIPLAEQHLQAPHHKSAYQAGIRQCRIVGSMVLQKVSAAGPKEIWWETLRIFDCQTR